MANVGSPSPGSTSTRRISRKLDNIRCGSGATVGHGCAWRLGGMLRRDVIRQPHEVQPLSLPAAAQVHIGRRMRCLPISNLHGSAGISDTWKIDAADGIFALSATMIVYPRLQSP